MLINYLKEFIIRILLIIICLLPFKIFGADNSTPIDGNLKIELSTPFFPDRILIYSDHSVLEERNIIYESKRIYKKNSMTEIIGYSKRTINSDVAWIDDETYVMLTGNSNSYPHDILGDNIESTGFQIYKNNDLILIYELSNGRVFETLRPLIVDLIPENDGAEIILTSSHRNDGARVDVYSQNGQLITSSEPVGRGFRWLHILGVITLGDSENQYLSVIKTPHIGGILELYYWNGTELKKKTSFNNVSSHRIGSDNLNMALLFNNNEINYPQIVVPSPDFRTLLMITLNEDKLVEVNRIDLPGILDTNLFYDNSYDQSIWLALTNGKIVRIIE